MATPDFGNLDQGGTYVPLNRGPTGPECLKDGEYDLLIEKAAGRDMKISGKYTMGGIIIDLHVLALTHDGKEGPRFVWSQWLGRGDKEDLGKWYAILVDLGFTDPNEWYAQGGNGVWMPKALKALSGVVFHATKVSQAKDKGGTGHYLNKAKRAEDHGLDRRAKVIDYVEMDKAALEAEEEVPF